MRDEGRDDPPRRARSCLIGDSRMVAQCRSSGSGPIRPPPSSITRRTACVPRDAAELLRSVAQHVADEVRGTVAQVGERPGGHVRRVLGAGDFAASRVVDVDSVARTPRHRPAACRNAGALSGAPMLAADGRSTPTACMVLTGRQRTARNLRSHADTNHWSRSASCLIRGPSRADRRHRPNNVNRLLNPSGASAPCGSESHPGHAVDQRILADLVAQLLDVRLREDHRPGGSISCSRSGLRHGAPREGAAADPSSTWTKDDVCPRSG